jgi:hypothetical protein
LEQLSGLKRLGVKNTEVSGAAIKDISKFKSLIWLDVTHSKITGPDLARLTNLDGLQELIADRVDHMSKFLKLVDQSKLKLKSLHLENDQLADSDLLQIAKIQSLESLNLGDNHLTVAGIKYLTALPRLDNLNLVGTDIGPAVIDTLAQIKGLRHVSLSSPPFRRADKDKLESLLPGCRVDLQVPTRR